jgi:hypothetical protein
MGGDGVSCSRYGSLRLKILRKGFSYGGTGNILDELLYLHCFPIKATIKDK